MTTIRFLHNAEEEMNASAKYYNHKVIGLGSDFLGEIEKEYTKM
jgi:hypothetical protein